MLTIVLEHLVQSILKHHDSFTLTWRNSHKYAFRCLNHGFSTYVDLILVKFENSLLDVVADDLSSDEIIDDCRSNFNLNFLWILI